MHNTLMTENMTYNSLDNKSIKDIVNQKIKNENSVLLQEDLSSRELYNKTQSVYIHKKKGT